MSDLGEMTLLPRLLRRLNQVAPNIGLDVVPLEISEVENWLNEGFIDAAICSQRLHGNGIEHTSLMEERYVCLMDAAHPSIHDQVSMDQFLEASHVLVSHSDHPWLQRAPVPAQSVMTP